MHRPGTVRIISFNRRLIRLRSTALPTFFVTVYPTRTAPSKASARETAWTDRSEA